MRAVGRVDGDPIGACCLVKKALVTVLSLARDRRWYTDHHRAEGAAQP
jgi:hypothetical protein